MALAGHRNGPPEAGFWQLARGNEMELKIEAFRAMLEAAQLQGLIDSHVDCEDNRMNALCSVKVGRKYANVDVGRSGKYMVELSTGAIYGVKAYGVIHRGHYYGTLDTIADYDWRGYTGARRAVKVAA